MACPKEPAHVMLVGHSYITHLSPFIDSHLPNLGLPPLSVTVHCLSLPGATVCPGRKCINNLTSEILEKKPNIVFLQIGENDVANGLCPFVVASEITHLVKSLTNKVERVIVGQLLPFPNLENKRQEIIATNQELQQRLSSVPNTKFWQQRSGFWKPVTNLVTGRKRAEVFAPDGVHLSAVGQHKFAFSVRVAVIKALTSIQYSWQRSHHQGQSSPSDCSYRYVELVELSVPLEMPDI